MQMGYGLPQSGPPPRKICSHFLRGACRFGAGCRDSHDTSSVSQPNVPSAPKSQSRKLGFNDQTFDPFDPRGGGKRQQQAFAQQQEGGFAQNGFGMAQQQHPAGSTGFGTAAQGFGQQQAQGFGQHQTQGFGGQPQGFGDQDAGRGRRTPKQQGFGGGFVQPSAGFGGQQLPQPQAQPVGFGQGGVYGQASQQRGGFGQPPQQTGFGQGFAQPAQPQGFGFNQPSQQGFGAVAPVPVAGFGQTQQVVGLGGQPGFGAPSQIGGFGQQPVMQPTAPGFGQAPQPGFGQPHMGFGQAAQTQQSTAPSRPCSNWQRTGTCKYGAGCKFQHIGAGAGGAPMQAQAQPQPPPFNNQFGAPQHPQQPQGFGGFNAAPQHGFQQPNIEQSQPGECRNFKQGSCKFGANCRFRHTGVQQETPVGMQVDSQPVNGGFIDHFGMTGGGGGMVTDGGFGGGGFGIATMMPESQQQQYQQQQQQQQQQQHQPMLTGDLRFGVQPQQPQQPQQYPQPYQPQQIQTQAFVAMPVKDIKPKQVAKGNGGKLRDADPAELRKVFGEPLACPETEFRFTNMTKEEEMEAFEGDVFALGQVPENVDAMYA